MSKKLVRVRMLTLAAGPQGIVPAGTVWEVEEAKAAEWVRGGFAELVEEDDAPQPVEKATAGPVEEATAAAPERAVGPRERGRTSRKGK